jgi:hypothetical protein
VKHFFTLEIESAIKVDGRISEQSAGMPGCQEAGTPKIEDLKPSRFLAFQPPSRYIIKCLTLEAIGFC